MRQTADTCHLLVCGVGVAPAEVLLDGTGEQDVFLEYHGDLFPQRLHVVLPHVNAADPHAALCGIVEAGDQLYQRALGAASAAEDAHGHAGGNVQVNVRQAALILALAVAEADVVEVHTAAGNGSLGVCRTGDVALFVQDLHDSFRRGTGQGDHHEYHGQHHQAAQNLCGVGHQTHQFAGGQRAADNHPCAEPAHENHAGVHAELHQRHVERQPFFCLGEVPIDVLRDPGELLLLVLFPHERLYHTDAVEVLLRHVVELIVGLEHPLKDGVYPCHNEVQPNAQHRNRCQIDQREPHAHAERHDHGENQHGGGTQGNAHQHLIGVLDIGNVRGQTGDNAGGGELVDVGERIGLHPIEHVVPQILGEAGGGVGSEVSGECAEQQGCDTANQQNAADVQDRIHTAVSVNAIVDELCHQDGDDHFHDDLQHHEQRRQKR